MAFFDHLATESLYQAALGLALVWYAIASYRNRTSPLHKIPTVGPSGILASRIGAIRSFFYGHEMVLEGYKKYPVFKIPRYFSWLVIVTGPDHLEDMRKATDDQMSFDAAANKALQFDYTISPKLRAHLFHHNVIRGPMTRSIGSRFPDFLDEIGKAFEDLLEGADNDWINIPCYSSVVHIVSRLSARYFVGLELSSNPMYTKLMQDYVFHVFRRGIVLRFLPNWLKPFVNNALFDSEGKTREVEEYLRPILTKRLERGIKDVDPDSNDMVTWLWNAAPEEYRTLHDIAIRMVGINIAAIHTTSSLLTNVLFNLATHTSYVEPLREEISKIIQEEGWNKISLEKMRKLDSFIKESQRVYGSAAAMVNRVVLSDFTFSDGTVVPKWADVAVAVRAINQDERFYPNPQEFQGFRFAEKDPVKWQMTALNPEFIMFGVGRHACPGRFFAVAEVKAIIGRILLDYDIKLTNEEAGRPKDRWFTGLFVSPNRKAKISLRKRRNE